MCFLLFSFYVFVVREYLTFNEAWHDNLDQQFYLTESGEMEAAKTKEKHQSHS